MVKIEIKKVKLSEIRLNPDNPRKVGRKKGSIPWNKGVHMWDGKEHPRGTLGKPSPLKGKKLSDMR